MTACRPRWIHQHAPLSVPTARHKCKQVLFTFEAPRRPIDLSGRMQASLGIPFRLPTREVARVAFGITSDRYVLVSDPPHTQPQ